jgi:hypothetical protein
MPRKSQEPSLGAAFGTYSIRTNWLQDQRVAAPELDAANSMACRSCSFSPAPSSLLSSFLLFSWTSDSWTSAIGLRTWDVGLFLCLRTPRLRPSDFGLGTLASSCVFGLLAFGHRTSDIGRWTLLFSSSPESSLTCRAPRLHMSGDIGAIARRSRPARRRKGSWWAPRASNPWFRSQAGRWVRFPCASATLLRDINGNG